MSDAPRGRNRRGAGKNKGNKGADNTKEIHPTPAPQAKQVTAHAEEDTVPPSPSLHSTPNRAFCAFNDSVDNVNLEDIRDLLPEEHPWRVGGHAGAPSMGNLQFVVNEDGEEGEVEGQPAAEVASSPYAPLDEKGALADTRDEVACEAVAGCGEGLPAGCVLDLCDAELEEAAAARVSAQLDEQNYIYGPTHFPARRRGLLWSLDHLHRPSAARSQDRSLVESAEMLLLALVAACGLGAGSSAAELSREDILKFRGEGTGGSACAEESGCGRKRSWGARVRGALGYVLHTLLSIYYQLFVHVPLLALHAFAAVVWSTTTTAFALAYVCVSFVLGSVLWLVLLPLRTVERVVVRLWQRTLSLAVTFLNQPPSESSHFNSAHSFPPHKHAIPTALNGHVHKH